MREIERDQEGEFPAEAMRLLLEGVAPERVSETSRLFSERSPQFFISETARRYGGFCALEEKSHILIAPNMRDALWFLSFASWHAFRAHIPQEVLANCLPPGPMRDELLLAHDEGFQLEETVCHDLVNLALDLVRRPVPPGTPWPPIIPFPAEVMDEQGRGATGPAVEHVAVKDLALFALAYILSHELRHLMFNSERIGISRRDEEFACDQFAIEQLLGRATEWKPQDGSSVDPVKIIFKRSMGLLVGFFVLHALTPAGRRGPQVDYPSLRDRLYAIVGQISVPDDHQLWLFGATLLRELQQDSGYAVLSTENTKTTKENFLSLAERGFR